jgi:hypothetical protein
MRKHSLIEALLQQLRHHPGKLIVRHLAAYRLDVRLPISVHRMERINGWPAQIYDRSLLTALVQYFLLRTGPLLTVVIPICLFGTGAEILLVSP